MNRSDFYELPEGTHTVSIGMGDLNGIMRGKRVPATHWKTACDDGIALSTALLTMDMTSDLWDTPYVNVANGYPDLVMFPITKPVSIPWEPGVAFCLAQSRTVAGEPLPIDPRETLVTQVERAKRMGFEVKTGTELEFYLLDNETLQPKEQGIQVYSLSKAAELEHVLGPIRQEINEMGIKIEQSNPEYAPGQVEVNIRYDEALLSADQIIMFRSLVKQLAARHGYLATFMAKPFISESGSGFHTHYSLWRNGQNAFADNGKLNQLGRHFLAGQQKYMAEIALAGSCTPNAYRRRQPYSFCPTNNAWGFDNRTVGLRVIEGSNSAVRVEKRDASADCNPYYLLACDLAAGLDGIEQKMEPSEPCLGDAYALESAEILPLTLEAAVEKAKASTLMTRVMGDYRKQILIEQAEREIGFVANQVTQVELDRYARNL